MSKYLLVLFLLGLPNLPILRAGEDHFALARKELEPRVFSMKVKDLLLSDALRVLTEKTGNIVVDRRGGKSDPKIVLDLENTTFWPALEAIARAADCGISLYQTDGMVALVDSPRRILPATYSGIFRIAIKRLAVIRDEETGTSTCALTLEVAWEPRFQPLYLGIGPMSATFSPDMGGKEHKPSVEGRGQSSVAGRNAFDVEVRLPAPNRSATKLTNLTGEFKFIGPGKMLTFAFAPLKTIAKANRKDHLEQTQDGVTVRLSELKAKASLWSADIEIENPRGGPVFESYQSWLSNNRITLEKGKDKSRQVWAPRTGDELELDPPPTASRAALQYYFKVQPDANPGNLADWTLIYRTPGRLVEIAVPFALRDLLLP